MCIRDSRIGIVAGHQIGRLAFEGDCDVFDARRFARVGKRHLYGKLFARVDRIGTDLVIADDDLGLRTHSAPPATAARAGIDPRVCSRVCSRVFRRLTGRLPTWFGRRLRGVLPVRYLDEYRKLLSLIHI